jgi:hypothetical protein
VAIGEVFKEVVVCRKPSGDSAHYRLAFRPPWLCADASGNGMRSGGGLGAEDASSFAGAALGGARHSGP